MLTLGYKASAEQFGPRELVELAVEAQQTGFESVMVSDHFQPWRHTDGHSRGDVPSGMIEHAEWLVSADAATALS